MIKLNQIAEDGVKISIPEATPVIRRYESDSLTVLRLIDGLYLEQFDRQVLLAAVEGKTVDSATVAAVLNALTPSELRTPVYGGLIQALESDDITTLDNILVTNALSNYVAAAVRAAAEVA